jgi:hypothetical protein
VAVWVAKLWAVRPLVLSRRVDRFDPISHQPFVRSIHIRHFEVQDAPRRVVRRCSVPKEDLEDPVVANRSRGAVGSFELDFQVEVLRVLTSRRSMVSDEDRQVIEVGHRRQSAFWWPPTSAPSAAKCSRAPAPIGRHGRGRSQRHRPLADRHEHGHDASCVLGEIAVRLPVSRPLPLGVSANAPVSDQRAGTARRRCRRDPGAGSVTHPGR